MQMEKNQKQISNSFASLTIFLACQHFCTVLNWSENIYYIMYGVLCILVLFYKVKYSVFVTDTHGGGGMRSPSAPF